jgi:hypothetical protein
MPLEARKKQVKLTFQGQTKSIPQWANAVGIHEDTIRFRLKRGWDHERILTTPVDTSKQRFKDKTVPLWPAPEGNDEVSRRVQNLEIANAFLMDSLEKVELRLQALAKQIGALDREEACV